MTIVTLAGHYYIPVQNGFKEIPFKDAMELYEKGLITHEEDLNVEYD
jgi:hypothetical protein